MRTRKEENAMSNMMHDHMRKLNWREDSVGFYKTHARVGQVFISIDNEIVGSYNFEKKYRTKLLETAELLSRHSYVSD